MVGFGPFEIHLVHADTKKPFREHDSPPADQSSAFVEIEPEAEYFIAVKRVKDTNKDLFLYMYVDGQRVSGCVIEEDEGRASFDYYGMQRKRGVYDALKFVRPPVAEAATTTTNLTTRYDTVIQTLMGHVRVVVSRAHCRTRRQRRKKRLKTILEPETISLPEDLRSAKEKAVRSTLGQNQNEVELTDDDDDIEWKPGETMGELTLRYGTAEALMKAGVLQQYNRQQQSASDDHSVNHRVGSPSQDSTAVKLIDLTDMPDSSNATTSAQRHIPVTPDQPADSSARSSPRQQQRHRGAKRRIIDLT